MQPIKSFMKNRNLVSDSSVGDKKKAYSFYSIMGWLAHFLGVGERKEKQVIKSSFISLLLHFFFFFRRCSISCTCTHALTNWTEWELKLCCFSLDVKETFITTLCSTFAGHFTLGLYAFSFLPHCTHEEIVIKTFVL